MQDIRDLEKTRALLSATDEKHPVDQAFLNAGVSSGSLPEGGPEPVEDACRTMHVNATSTINMAGLLLLRMLQRNEGHVAFTSSLAALFPLPDSPSYCAAKSAISCYANAMRGALINTRVRVSILYPGYVDTPMSRRFSGPQPFRWTAKKAAEHIRDRLDKGADSIVFPRLLALGMCLLHALPFRLALVFLKWFRFSILPDKESPGKSKEAGMGENGRD
jgi:NADP-dependent 3-hydroxy acid dehydrogenase YdfG